tara:strand:- start:482 stop:640 length:159 start_codon:yes stop_codon:yes gene_type:complete
MASIVAAAELDATKIEQIHQISYTTENALAKIGGGQSAGRSVGRGASGFRRA